MISGRVKCPTISPTLSAPSYPPVSYAVGSGTTVHSFAPFTISGPDIPACGFSSYEIIAEDDTGVAVSLVNPDANCNTISDCLRRNIPID